MDALQILSEILIGKQKLIRKYVLEKRFGENLYGHTIAELGNYLDEHKKEVDEYYN